MIVEHFVGGEKAVAEICDGRWILRNPVEVIEGNFIVSACHVLADQRFSVEKCVLVNGQSKNYERFLLFSDGPFIVVTGNAQKNLDHITFNLIVPGVIEGDEVSDIPLLDRETDLVHRNVSVDGFVGKLTTLARTIRLAEISPEELFTTYGFLNRGGDRGNFVYSKKDLVGHRIVSEKFHEFDYTSNAPAITWIPHDFALSVVRIANLSRYRGISVTEMVKGISSKISEVKARMK